MIPSAPSNKPDGASDRNGRGECAHCGLPLPRPLWGRSTPEGDHFNEAAEPAFCCFGCRLAAAVSSERGESGSNKRTLARLGLSIFFSMNVMAFTMALWTADVYPAAGQATPALASTFYGLFRHLVLLFSMPVLFLLGLPLWENAVEGVKRGVFSTDLLLTAGVLAAYLYSSVSVIRGEGPIYFEVGCVVLVMVTLGRWLEATGKHKANDALDRLARLMPERVRLLRDGQEVEVPLDEVEAGDLLRVLAGERIPADGRIQRGVAFLDQQVLTGESSPELRQAGDTVLGGTLNLDGDLQIQVTATGAAGTLARLIELVRTARLAKGRYERLADRVSAWFVPAITAIAVLTFVGHTLTHSLEQGMLQALAVVLIACPCALGLATPLAVWSALGQAAGKQVLFRSGESLERLASVRAVRFDKTGTLTTGRPMIASLLCEGSEQEAQVLRVTRTLASSSSHVLARVVMDHGQLAAMGDEVTDVRAFSGRGIAGTIVLSDIPTRTFLGSLRLLEENQQQIGSDLKAASQSPETARRTSTWIAWGGLARGLFTFDEQLRPSARVAIKECRNLGLDLGVLTGDHVARGAALADEIGVPVQAGLLPEEKVAAIEAAHAAFGSVAMVGDGVNDAPALAASDVGVALGCGTDLSRESAGVCLLGDELDRLPWAIGLARRTMSTIRWNLLWAFGYNAVGVACAAFGWLSPAFAAFLMVGSSVFVILNSLRLQGEAAEPLEPKPDQPVVRSFRTASTSDSESVSANIALTEQEALTP